MTPPRDYTAPEIGSYDNVGYQGTGLFCLLSVIPNIVCTLPKGHWCDFHVAHGVGGRVIAVRHPAYPEWLRLPEGM